ncbi:MAG TPA: hypothetical protein VG873_08930, partial [Burkholderiales bacterium]|nr:hypothetical protein [Burkholderiales bacterium]
MNFPRIAAVLAAFLQAGCAHVEKEWPSDDGRDPIQVVYGVLIEEGVDVIRVSATIASEKGQIPLGPGGSIRVNGISLKGEPWMKTTLVS